MPTAKNKDTKSLYWRFDLSTFRLLGRELITDRITALFELVKNAYDANAKNVHVEFIDINPAGKNSKIIIRDDGLGMTESDIRDKWMVIGTSSKRKTRVSPAPFNRKMVGKKGVGRFAVDKLGSALILKTKKAKDAKYICLETDWESYDKLSKQYDLFEESPDTKEKKKYFTDVENKYWMEDGEGSASGTTLEISSIRDPWSKDDIERAYKELAKLISPLSKTEHPFNIFINSTNYPEYKNKEVKNKAIKYATHTFSLDFDLKTKTQKVLKFEDSSLKTVTVPLKTFGPVKFKLYYFDQKAKDQFKKEYKGGNIDGIKIYRDGLIATPFAEYEGQDIKKRDILGIDKRRYSGFFDKVSSSDLIGIIEISDADNPNIKDSTNRQDFEDNKEYRELKQFIIDQIQELENYLKSLRDTEKEKTKSDLKTARTDLSSVTSLVKAIKKKAPAKLKKELEDLEKQTKKVKIDVDKGIKAYNELEKEKVRQENIFLSLMSLQDYALEIAHVVRTSLSRIIRLADFFKNEFPNPELDDIFITYSKDIYNEMTKLDGAVDFMLSYARSNTDFKEINIKELIEELFTDSYRDIFTSKGIRTIVEIDKPLMIVHNQKFFEDIIENLISNSIKALEDTTDKLIKCTGTVEADKFILLFSDNGSGIKEEDWNRIFNIYFTRTEEQGGAGIGLYIVKTRIESMKGSIQVVESELKPSGATFKIVLPFANK